MKAHDQAAVFSTGNEEWTTPRWLFDQLDAEFHFTLDAAATDDNHLCREYFTKTHDALQYAWMDRFYLNPPYSRYVGRWVQYAWEQVYLHRNTDVGVLLIAARTDTRWFHDYAWNGAEVRLVKGRLHYGNSPNAATFPSAGLVFDHRKIHPVVFSRIEQPIGRNRR